MKDYIFWENNYTIFFYVSLFKECKLLKEKFAPKFFSLREAPFGKDYIIQKANRKLKKLFSLLKMVKIFRYFHFTEKSEHFQPDSIVQLVGHLTRKSGVLGSIPGLATCFRFSFRFLKKGSCQLLAKVCARSTG